MKRKTGKEMNRGEGGEALDYILGKRNFDWVNMICLHIRAEPDTLLTWNVVSLGKRMRAGQIQSLRTLNLVSQGPCFVLILLTILSVCFSSGCMS